MRILMLSWEYPPVVVGGLGRHVHALARKLGEQGHDVVVLCRQPTGSDAATNPTSDFASDGVRVIRIAEDPPALYEQLGGIVAGVAFVVELTFLGGRAKLNGYNIFSLLQYDK